MGIDKATKIEIEVDEISEQISEQMVEMVATEADTSIKGDNYV